MHSWGKSQIFDKSPKIIFKTYYFWNLLGKSEIWRRKKKHRQKSWNWKSGKMWKIVTFEKTILPLKKSYSINWICWEIFGNKTEIQRKINIYNLFSPKYENIWFCLKSGKYGNREFFEIFLRTLFFWVRDLLYCFGLKVFFFKILFFFKSRNTKMLKTKKYIEQYILKYELFFLFFLETNLKYGRKCFHFFWKKNPKSEKVETFLKYGKKLKFCENFEKLFF